MWYVVRPSVYEMKYISFEKYVYADDAVPPCGDEDVDQLCNLIDSSTAEGNYPSARSQHTTFHIIRPWSISRTMLISGQSQWPLACWECRFEFHQQHGRLSLVSVVCCEVFV